MTHSFINVLPSAFKVKVSLEPSFTMASSFPSGDFTENVSAIALAQNNHAKAIARRCFQNAFIHTQTILAAGGAGSNIFSESWPKIKLVKFRRGRKFLLSYFFIGAYSKSSFNPD